jgi:hypothetical protein
MKNVTWIASICANDDEGAERIDLGYQPHIDSDGNDGYRVITSNGDSIGYYAAQTEEECIIAIYAMYDKWDTFSPLD